MRKPDFTPSINPNKLEPELEFRTLLLKLHIQHFWHTTKELIEHLGGHVFVAPEPARKREFFVRDTVIFLHDGKLLIPNFSQQDVSDVTQSESNVVVNQLRQIANIEQQAKLPFAIDGANLAVWDKVKGSEIALLSGKHLPLLMRDVLYFQTHYPDRVIPMHLDPSLAKRIFHGDFVTANIPGGFVLGYPEFLASSASRDAIKRVLGENFYRLTKKQQKRPA